ncbi:TRAP transporter small permease subunit [Rubrivirga sp.]|uniref:TRAP transporter small permease subunit n=1 Tax=Rubrivirga sp. TaxID=1885344 RepID=UPI003C78B693
MSLADRLSSAVGWLASRLVVVLVVSGGLAALFRYVGPMLGVSPALNALGDIQWMVFSAVFLLGAAWGLSDDAHVRVDVVYGRLRPRGRAIIDLLGTVLLLLPLCALLLWASWPAVLEAIAIRESALDAGGLARWPVKLLVPLGLGLLAVQGVAQALKAIAVLSGADLEALPEQCQEGA